jgi:hypothetical protein
MLERDHVGEIMSDDRRRFAECEHDLAHAPKGLRQR